MGLELRGQVLDGRQKGIDRSRPVVEHVVHWKLTHWVAVARRNRVVRPHLSRPKTRLVVAGATRPGAGGCLVLFVAGFDLLTLLRKVIQHLLDAV